MAQKIAIETNLTVLDIIKFQSDEGVNVYYVVKKEEFKNLGTFVSCSSYSEGVRVFYQAELVSVGAEVITVGELVMLFNESQKVLREYEKDAIDRARREDSSGGKFS